MNILDSEELPGVERQMLAVEPLPAYVLSHPALHASPRATHALPARFEPAAEPALLRLLPGARGGYGMKEEEAGAVAKVFVWALLGLLYPRRASEPNRALLETLKCTLYSRDLDFSAPHSHSPARLRAIDSLQAKAMITRFLHALTESSLSNAERVRGGVAILESSALLVEALVVFLRAILGKLEVEGGEDCSFPLPFEPAVENLLEFFDVPHRQLPSLFLLHDDGYYLASANGLFFGEYIENDGKAKTSDTREQLKSNEGTMKKNGVLHNDIRLFNFLLESGEGGPAAEKSKEIETPHFKETQEFAFGRSRRETGQLERQEELKREFEKLIMNCDEHEEELGPQQNDSPATPVIGSGFDPFRPNEPQWQEQQQERTERQEREEEKEKPKAFLRKSTFNQSPLADQDPLDSPKLNPEHSRGIKNIVSVKDKHAAAFSPQPQQVSRGDNFGSFANDAAFLDADPQGDYFKSSSGRIAELALPLLAGECRCLQSRRNKNRVCSRVVEFVHAPRNSGARSPRFLHTLKHSQNINVVGPKIKVTPPKERNAKEGEALCGIREQRIPTFLKSLRKDKEKDKYSASSKSKSKHSKDHSHSPSPTPTPPPPPTPIIAPITAHPPKIDADTISRINSRFAKFSTILSSKCVAESHSRGKQSASGHKNESSSLSRRVATELGVTIKRFDTRFANARPGLGGAWKSTSNFHLPYKKPQEGLGTRETMRCAPVAIHLRGSNARPEPGVGAGSKLALAHSSEKYREAQAERQPREGLGVSG